MFEEEGSRLRCGNKLICSWIIICLIALSMCPCLFSCRGGTRTNYYPPAVVEARECPSKAELWDRVEDCKFLASGGDLKAALTLAKFYDHLGHDKNEARTWYAVAAKLGDPDSQYMQGTRPNKTYDEDALQWLTRAAKKGNYCAQAELGAANFESTGVERNWAQAYFWYSAAERYSNNLDYIYNQCVDELRYDPRAKGWIAAVCLGKRNDAHTKVHSCRASFKTIAMISDLKSKLPPTVSAAVDDAVGQWTPDKEIPSFPIPDIIVEKPKAAPKPQVDQRPKIATKPPDASQTSPQPSSPPRPSIVAKPSPQNVQPAFQWPAWAKIDSTLKPAMNVGQLEADKLYNQVSTSVWVISARKISSYSAKESEVVIGSAVAISKRLLLTNCHVLKDSSSIQLLQGTTNIAAKIHSADETADRCVISAAQDLPTSINGLREYKDLKVGEKVYSIGSPSGLERTLGEGIISGLRSYKARRLVQTTAPISPGSSGGGLFDSAGNLIGITTFLLRDAQNLNFAIAASDFWAD